MTKDRSLRIEDSPQLAAESFNDLIGGGNDPLHKSLLEKLMIF
jgi:hypothetical protein